MPPTGGHFGAVGSRTPIQRFRRQHLPLCYSPQGGRRSFPAVRGFLYLYSATNSTRGAVVVSAGVEPAAAIGGGFRRALCQLSYDTVDSCPNCAGDTGAVAAACPVQPFLRKGLSLERRFLCGTEEGRYRPPHDDYAIRVNNLFKLFFRNFIHPVTTGNFGRRSRGGTGSGG